MAAIALTVTGCGGRSSAGRSTGFFTAQQVRETFAAHHYRLSVERGYSSLGPSRHVLYLKWVSPPPYGAIVRHGVRMVVARYAFYVLVFRSSRDAAAALDNPGVKRELRLNHFPVLRKDNVVAATPEPIVAGEPLAKDWRHWTAVLRSLGT